MSDETIPPPSRPLIPVQVCDDLSSEQIKQVEEGITHSAKEQIKPGPTGQYPEGRINMHDEGEIAISVAVDIQAQRVVVDFGKSIKWLAFNPDQARDMGRLLIDKADHAQRVM